MSHKEIFPKSIPKVCLLKTQHEAPSSIQCLNLLSTLSLCTLIIPRKSFHIAIINDCIPRITRWQCIYFFKPVLNYVIKLCSIVKKIIYFTDGAASQYTNYKNMANLTQHIADFQLKDEYLLLCYIARQRSVQWNRWNNQKTCTWTETLKCE